MLSSICSAEKFNTGVKPISVLARYGANGPIKNETLWLVEEDTVTIDVVGVGNYTLMWTPTSPVLPPLGFTPELGICSEHNSSSEILSIALGFIFTEGIVTSISQIRMMSVCPDEPSIVRVTLFEPGKVVTRRKDIVMTSSCGVCGGRDVLDQNLNNLMQVSDNLTMSYDDFAPMMSMMREKQSVFEQSGGSHAAAVFNHLGELLTTAEDLGRHNALDKIIGDCLLHNMSMTGKGVLLSSRISLEMVTKAAVAGFEIIAAVSAPTSLAVRVAQQCGITLCGFVRGDRVTVYTHSHRIHSR